MLRNYIKFMTLLRLKKYKTLKIVFWQDKFVDNLIQEMMDEKSVIVTRNSLVRTNKNVTREVVGTTCYMRIWEMWNKICRRIFLKGIIIWLIVLWIVAYLMGLI